MRTINASPSLPVVKKPPSSRRRTDRYVVGDVLRVGEPRDVVVFGECHERFEERSIVLAVREVSGAAVAAPTVAGAVACHERSSRPSSRRSRSRQKRACHAASSQSGRSNTHAASASARAISAFQREQHLVVEPGTNPGLPRARKGDRGPGTPRRRVRRHGARGAARCRNSSCADRRSFPAGDAVVVDRGVGLRAADSRGARREPRGRTSLRRPRCRRLRR